jgi:hypothetical protein
MTPEIRAKGKRIIATGTARDFPRLSGSAALARHIADILGREPTPDEIKTFEDRFAAAFSAPEPRPEFGKFNRMKGSYETISDEIGE